MNISKGQNTSSGSQHPDERDVALVYDLKSSDLKSGLAVRSPNWLGDAVMALPAMSCLRKMLPDNCGFFISCPDNLAPLFESIPWVTSIVRLDSGHSRWTRAQLKSLRSLNAGAGFLFVNSLKSAWYFRRAGIKQLFGASSGLRNIFMTRHFNVKWHKTGQYSETHQSEKYLSMAYALGAPEWDKQYPDFRCLSLDEINMPGMKEAISNKETNRILSVAPGAAYGPAKRWTADHFSKVCKYWINSKKGIVIALGAKNEYNTVMEVIRELPADRIINMAGKTSLKELMFILRNSDLCLSNDSGIMHLGSALSVNGIAVFGSTDPYATGPLSPKWKIMIKPQPCAPCFSRECVNHDANYKCLHSIKPDDVCKEIDKLF